MMDSLESRQLFTAAPAVTVVHVGPTEAVKTLDAVKWPATSSHAKLDIIVDFSATPYSVSHHGFGGDVTIEPADPKNEPTFQLQPTNYPTLYSNYKLYIHNIKTVGGNKGILTGTNTGGSVDVEHVTMTDGGAIWRGQGCVNAVFKDNDDLGMAYDYVYSNFTRHRPERAHRQQRHQGARAGRPEGSGHPVHGHQQPDDQKRHHQAVV